MLESSYSAVFSQKEINAIYNTCIKVTLANVTLSKKLCKIMPNVTNRLKTVFHKIELGYTIRLNTHLKVWFVMKQCICGIVCYDDNFSLRKSVDGVLNFSIIFALDKLRVTLCSAPSVFLCC